MRRLRRPCASMESLADDPVARGQLNARDRAAFVSSIQDAARDGRFSMRLTMYGVVARVPGRIG